jgi:hypothetical protein
MWTLVNPPDDIIIDGKNVVVRGSSALTIAGMVRRSTLVEDGFSGNDRRTTGF